MTPEGNSGPITIPLGKNYALLHNIFMAEQYLFWSTGLVAKNDALLGKNDALLGTNLYTVLIFSSFNSQILQ